MYQTFFQDLYENIQTYYSDLVDLLPKLILALIALLFFWWAGNRVKKLVKYRLAERTDDPLLTVFLARVSKVIFVLIGFLLFLRIVGLGDAAASILATAGFSAFIIGFAFKDIGENFLAGIFMAFNRPFKVGDTVETMGITGVITGLSLRETLIKTFDGKDVYIPNGQILKNPLFNYTIDGFLRYDFELDLDYSSDVMKAAEVVLEELKTVKGILHDFKPPATTLSSAGNRQLTLKVYFWIDTMDKEVSIFAVKKDAISKSVAALLREGFELPANVIELKNYQNYPFKNAEDVLPPGG